MKSRMFAIAVMLLAVSIPAQAGKEEREALNTRTKPAVEKAEKDFKSACGCPLPITIDESTLKSKDDFNTAAYIADSISEGAPKYCTDGASKKAMCQLKSLTIGKAAEATFTFKGGKGVATTDGNAACTWDMMTREIDK